MSRLRETVRMARKRTHGEPVFQLPANEPTPSETPAIADEQATAPVEKPKVVKR